MKGAKCPYNFRNTSYYIGIYLLVQLFLDGSTCAVYALHWYGNGLFSPLFLCIQSQAAKGRQQSAQSNRSKRPHTKPQYQHDRGIV